MQKTWILGTPMGDSYLQSTSCFFGAKETMASWDLQALEIKRNLVSVKPARESQVSDAATCILSHSTVRFFMDSGDVAQNKGVSTHVDGEVDCFLFLKQVRWGMGTETR
jgi:hypothetical protein